LAKIGIEPHAGPEFPAFDETSGTLLKLRSTVLPFPPCEEAGRILSHVHRSSDAAAPSLGVSSLDLGLRFGVGLFLCAQASAAASHRATGADRSHRLDHPP
jgi:hypothetical protein